MDLDTSPTEPTSISSVKPDDIAGAPPPVVLDMRDIICWHGRLDPKSSGDMKRLRIDAYTKIVEKTGCVFEPYATPGDVCEDCVRTTFLGAFFHSPEGGCR